MRVERKYIVVQITERDWYVCAPPITDPGDYRAMSKPLSRPEAMRVCKELTELEPAEWSEATKQAVNWTEPETARMLSRASIHHVANQFAERALAICFAKERSLHKPDTQARENPCREDLCRSSFRGAKDDTRADASS